MKSTQSMIMAAVAAAGLSGCVTMLPPPGAEYPPGPGGPGYPPPSHGSDHAAAYRAGVAAGEADARAGLSPNHQRHAGSYSPAFENDFRGGYIDGYGGTRPDDPGSPRQAYQDGYRLGLQDAENGRSENYRRHAGTYHPRHEADFSQGYSRGYAEGDVPPPPRPTPAFESGYSYGSRDAQMGRPANYRRHAHAYSPATEWDFRRGYESGFQGR